MTPREKEFEALVREFLELGTLPTPKNLHPQFGNGHNLKGSYVKIRTRILREHGYEKIRGRWRKNDPEGA